MKDEPRHIRGRLMDNAEVEGGWRINEKVSRQMEKK